MGFHIPDSPPRRNVSSATSQTTTATTAAITTSTRTTSTSTSTDTDGVQFSERFSMRRRNAIVPSLFIDVVGSPRSPYVCLSRDHRLALSQQHDHERAQQTTEREAMSREAVSAEDRDVSMANSTASETVKRAPGICRHVEHRDASTEAHFGTRATLMNASDVP